MSIMFPLLLNKTFEVLTNASACGNKNTEYRHDVMYQLLITIFPALGLHTTQWQRRRTVRSVISTTNLL